MNSETKTCQNCKQSFTVEPEDFEFYEKIKVLPPTWCPECRMARRFAWRNEHTLFRRKDDHDGKDIFSGIPPQSQLKVYENTYWWSDNFDASEYARNYDFSRPFFEQFRDLLYSVPWAAKSVVRMINSDYCDQAGDFKNCYLCFNGDKNEDCAYTFNAGFNKDSFDLNLCYNNELCYGSVTTNKSYKVFFSSEVEDSTDIWFSRNLVGCNNCIGCANLRKKSYHIFNVPYSREEYQNKVKELKLDSHTGLESLRKTAREFWLKFPVKYMIGFRNYNSYGDRLFDTKNAESCYRVSNVENVKYCQDTYTPKTTDCYDYTTTWGSSSRIYESLSCGEQVDMIRFCFDCWPSCTYLEYCASCHSSSNLFGCVGLKKNQYCVLNKQYSKEEYEELVPKIRAQMDEMPYIDKKGRVYKYGEFFPIELSPFAYNETVLDYTFPKTLTEAENEGYTWREPENNVYNITINSENLPDSIQDATEGILKENIKCENCGKAYRILAKEFEFLKNAGIPLPQQCFKCRLVARQKFINPPVFYKRHCMRTGCENEFETSYSPDRPEIIYCESCYQNEVV